MELSKEKYLNDTYSMPFEGEEHLGTVIELPFRTDVWRNDARAALWDFMSVILSIAQFEKVYVVASKEALSKNTDILSPLFSNFNVQVLPIEYDDSWARDNAPVFTRNNEGEICGVNWGFNAWGGTYNGLYDSWDKDNSMGTPLLSSLNIDEFKIKDFILEGGSIHTNGKGTLVTTEECLLSKGRNPNLTKNQIEDTLKKVLGQKKIIWLPYGVYNDETSGHVDNMACFLDETHVLLASIDDKNDPMYERYKIDLEVLKNETTADGKKIEVIEMPVPGPLYMNKEEQLSLANDDHAIVREQGNRLAGSYVNFYMGKEFIILPTFNDPNDQKAYDILNSFYKGKKRIIQIPGREILLGGGNIHCITKQIPMPNLKEKD